MNEIDTKIPHKLAKHMLDGRITSADAPDAIWHDAYDVFTELETLNSIKRPDTAKRMTEAHAALSHSQWLEHKVNTSRAGLADGTNRRIAPEEWAKVRAAKQKQRDSL